MKFIQAKNLQRSERILDVKENVKNRKICGIDYNVGLKY